MRSQQQASTVRVGEVIEAPAHGVDNPGTVITTDETSTGRTLTIRNTDGEVHTVSVGRKEWLWVHRR
jgi:hypothetical protein